jgi:hypothetical protein
VTVPVAEEEGVPVPLVLRSAVTLGEALKEGLAVTEGLEEAHSVLLLLEEPETVKAAVTVTLTLPVVEALPEVVGEEVPLPREPEALLLAEAVAQWLGE